MEIAQAQMQIYVHKSGSQCNSPSRKNLRCQHNIAHGPRPDESFESCRACRGREELQVALHFGIVEPRTSVVIVCPRRRPPRLCPRRCLPNGTKLRPCARWGLQFFHQRFRRPHSRWTVHVMSSPPSLIAGSSCQSCSLPCPCRVKKLIHKRSE